MSAPKTLIWAMVLLVLAAFYYFYDIQGGKRRHERTRQQELVLQVSAAEITGITLKRPDQTLTAVKHQEHWQLTAPLTAPADTRKYQELVHFVTALRYLRQVETEPASLAPFGLAPASVEVQIERQEHAQPLLLRLGTANPTGSGYYAQIAGRPTVYLIPTAAKDMLGASLYDLRDKTVVAFESTNVEEVRIEVDDRTPIVLQRHDDKHWHMTAPVSASGDTDAVHELLQRLREAQVQAFVAETPADLEPYGLHVPTLRLALRLGKDRAVTTLVFGQLDAEKQGVYAKLGDAGNVLLLPQSLWDALPKTATALRDKTLLRYDRDRIVRIELHTPDEPLVITRTAPTHYVLEQPIRDAASREAIAQLLEHLQTLKALDFVTETTTTLAPYGLESPRLRVVLAAEAGAEAREQRQYALRIGDDAPHQQGTYAQLDTQSTVYLLAKDDAQRLLETTAFSLREKKLLAFEPAAVHKLRVQYPASTYTLVRQKDIWKVSQPRSETIQQSWKVDNLLYALQALEYANILTNANESDARYGLETPQVQITLWSTDGTAVGPLTIGARIEAPNPEERFAYAKVEAKSSLYVVPMAVLDHLPKTPEELLVEK